MKSKSPSGYHVTGTICRRWYSWEKYYLLENELGKIDEYVEQVLYYARLDSFSRDYLLQEYSLKEIVQSVVRTQANYFIQKDCNSQLKGRWSGFNRPKMGHFIFRQLLSNAVKYTPEGGTITVLISKINKVFIYL